MVAKSPERKLKKRVTTAPPREQTTTLPKLRTLENKTQNWLENNTLNALKLTLFDLLAKSEWELDDNDQIVVNELVETPLYKEVSLVYAEPTNEIFEQIQIVRNQ